jgi:CRISPR-associated protein Cst2
MGEQKANCVTFTVIVKVNGNVNGGWGEDIISTIKKIRLPDSTMRAYISGQALRRMSRDQLKSMGYHISSKMLGDIKNEKQPIPTEADPEKNIDDDLYGYMKTGEKKASANSRISPVRVSPAVSFFPYNFERDLGLQNNNDIGKPNRFYETEISDNFYVYTVLIELDRIGRDESKQFVSDNERRNRIKAVIKSYQHLWGGGKQSRLLSDMSPKFIIYQSQTIKKPSYLDYILMDEDRNIDVNLLKNGYQNSRDISVNTIVGIDAIINNYHELNDVEIKNVLNINEAFDAIYKDIDSLQISELNEQH